jgi:hypothetical protein
MKKKVLASLVLLILAFEVNSQDGCKIELQTDYGAPTEAKFYLKLGNDTIRSVRGVIQMNKEMYDNYKDKKVMIYFNDKGLVTKLYKLPSFAVKPVFLRELCGVHKLERRF